MKNQKALLIGAVLVVIGLIAVMSLHRGHQSSSNPQEDAAENAALRSKKTGKRPISNGV